MNPYQPPQQQQHYYAPPPPVVQHVVHYHQSPPKSAGAAVVLELLPGFFFQTFGIGNMYAGNVGLGLLFMFGYWFVLFVNILLCFVLIGFITLPVCWILMLILAPLTAANRASSNH
jgi:TM2 domain-containing membrane protein YozV